ncbi:hypothetical protein QCA50_016905 [Cerrena zonata]|uniref:Uncharacterized protein n=1 Tax=Cerrena zonata TaxID=2478898 RepID=A0AAW0FNZ1_9APHY
MPVPFRDITRQFGPASTYAGNAVISQGGSNECQYSFPPPRTRSGELIGAGALSNGFTYPIQFIAGIMCLKALFASKRRINTVLFRLFIYQTIGLMLANTAGFIVSLISFHWYIGPYEEIAYQLLASSGSDFLCANLWFYEGLSQEAQSWIVKFNTVNIVSNVIFEIVGMLTDAMLIWRCRQIWKFTLFSKPNLVILLPVLLFVGSMVLGITTLSDVDIPLFDGINLAEAYFGTSLALNVSLTLLIVCRLLKCKLQSQKVLGEAHVKHYTVITMLFVESAFMNAVCSIILLATYTSTGYTFLVDTGLVFTICISAMPAVQACANYLIIYRGTQGFYGSWSNEVSVSNAQTISFRSPDVSTVCD